jgi:hypothetical protein
LKTEIRYADIHREAETGSTTRSGGIHDAGRSQIFWKKMVRKKMGTLKEE